MVGIVLVGSCPDTPGEHSGQSPLYRRAHANSQNHNTIRIYTPESRAAIWIKCLAEGQKYQATVGIELVAAVGKKF